MSSGACDSCGDCCKYSNGGKVKGVHEKAGHKVDSDESSFDNGSEQSKAGVSTRYAKEYHTAPSTKKMFLSNVKDEHREKLKELKDMPNPKLQGLSDGGEVRGVHKSYMEKEAPRTGEYGSPRTQKRWAGRSAAGEAVSDTTHSRLNPDNQEKKHNENQYKKAKDEHHRVLGELKAMPNPKIKGLAHGGEVKGFDMDGPETKAFMEKGEFTSESEGGEIEDMDNEMMDMCCDELLKAIESKDKKEILESLKAIILSVKG